ncbi:MAG: hypothetical protein ACYDCN_02375 [Bacteroidia bacterium]
MMSDTKTTTVENLTVSEAAAYVGVSARTIERHAAFKKYVPLSDFRNGRKTKVYNKKWIDNNFKDDGQKSDKDGQSQTNADKHSDTNTTTLVARLTDEVGFLRKEIDVKNEVISKLQESERQTKTLLADLQFKQKELLLNAPPTAKKLEKKYTWFWSVAFIVVLGAIGTGCYFSFEYLQSLLK